VSWLSDAVLAHLCKVADWPDLGGTRYELVEKIGQGGMGTVFLARDHALDRPVALKVLNAAPDNAEARARMMKEAIIVARLEHPSIVPVHDCGVLPDGRYYYAMKLVRGKRLDEPAGRPTALAERLQLFQKICDAVAFAHANGVLHRDLKPQNIMLGAFGEVLVLDWGLAKQVGEKTTPAAKEVDDAESLGPAQTGHGTVLGTPGYMAPEQARGEMDLIDERADVYALGAILYFLLTDQAPAGEALPLTPPSPLRGEGGVRGSKTNAGAALTPPRRRGRSIPRPLQAICLKALAAERTERYASVTELGADITDFLGGRRVRAYPEGPLEITLRLATKYRTVLALILAYLLMRILLLVFVNP
jgi:serine/threonine protein kinase